MFDTRGGQDYIPHLPRAAYSHAFCSLNRALLGGRIVDLKEQLMNQAMKMMQDPRVMKAMQNPKVMQTLMGAIQMRAKMQQEMDAQLEKVAKSLKLATRSEVRELKRALTKLERELQQKQQQTKSAE